MTRFDVYKALYRQRYLELAKCPYDPSSCDEQASRAANQYAIMNTWSVWCEECKIYTS